MGWALLPQPTPPSTATLDALLGHPGHPALHCMVSTPPRRCPPRDPAGPAVPWKLPSLALLPENVSATPQAAWYPNVIRDIILNPAHKRGAHVASSAQVSAAAAAAVRPVPGQVPSAVYCHSFHPWKLSLSLVGLCPHSRVCGLGPSVLASGPVIFQPYSEVDSQRIL